MKQRLQYHGGANQQDRMIAQKLRSMLAATKYSYQGARFSTYPTHAQEFVGLFNPIVQNESFDTKMISIPYESGYKVGDIFKWHNTDTFWISFLQDKTELAYFRGHCRRCDYKVQWVNKDREVLDTLISVIGPSVPTLRTSSSMQAKVAEDFPNANLKVLTTDNEQNRQYFNRYQRFILKGTTYIIEEVDNLSMPGVIQMTATEHYSNKLEDDVENNLLNAWNVQPIIPSHVSDYAIDGPNTIKPKFENKYEALTIGGRWIIVENKDVPDKSNLPAKFVELDLGQKTVTLYWDSLKSGQFTLGYLMPNGILYQKAILVESLM